MKSFLVELPDLRIIDVRGEQRDEYLHGQLTINTKQFDENKARIGAHCDFKGKMWSVYYISRFNESYHLIQPSASAEQSIAQLKKYGVFSKVDIELLGDEWHVLGGAGDEALQHIKVLFPSVEEAHLSHCANEFGHLISFNDNSKRFLLALKTKGLQRLKDIAEDMFVDDPNHWHFLEISAGLGFIHASTVGEFVPQMFNLQSLDGIDFDKGCYMGQEVVARTKFLGKNKRALFLLCSNDDVELQPGDALEKRLGDNWRRGGTVISRAHLSGTTKILAVLANDTDNTDVLRSKTSQSEFTIEDLPYAVEGIASN